MPPELNRRASDRRPLDIDSMIAEENDPKQRAFLIVMNSINVSLLANTETIRDISIKLDTHLTNFEEHTATEDALLNRGRGMWKVTSWVLGASQAAVIALSLGAYNHLSGIDSAISVLQVADAKLEARVTAGEKK